MTYNNENAMMETKKDFILPAMVEDDCISVDVSEDYEGLRLSFPRVKIPGGGSLQFEIPSDDPENPDYTKYIEGVILYNHDTCAYWPEGSEYDDNVTPLCSSVDGKTGYGAPGGVCATCALNQYGSVEKGKRSSFGIGRQQMTAAIGSAIGALDTIYIKGISPRALR